MNKSRPSKGPESLQLHIVSHLGIRKGEILPALWAFDAQVEADGEDSAGEFFAERRLRSSDSKEFV